MKFSACTSSQPMAGRAAAISAICGPRKPMPALAGILPARLTAPAPLIGLRSGLRREAGAHDLRARAGGDVEPGLGIARHLRLAGTGMAAGGGAVVLAGGGDAEALLRHE